MHIKSLLLLTAAIVPTMASAQSDVVIMRRVIAPPTRSATPTPSPGQGTPTPSPGQSGSGFYSWNVSTWKQSGTCGQVSNETRDVTCVRTDGTVVADSFCYGDNSGPRPVDTLAAVNTQSCSYSWNTSDFGSPTTTCGQATLRRDVTCVRSDGAIMADASCGGSKPPSTESQLVTSGCGYGWNVGDWSVPVVTSCEQTTVTRPVTCQRSDGATVADGLCATAKPDESEKVYTCGTGVAWHVTEWGSAVPGCGNTVQTRSVACQDTSGSVYLDSVCAAPKPSSSEPAKDYSTCTDGRTAANPYGWTIGDYAGATPACGATVDVRTVTCTDDDGHAVPDAQCLMAKPSTTRPDADHSACTYSYVTGDYGSPQPACGATVTYRPVYCQRSDGLNVEGSFCQGKPPEATEPSTDYSACTFGWVASGWSAPSTTCGDATETRTVTCQRADGSAADDAQCSSAGAKPATSQTTHETSSCGLSWSTGDWTPAPACGATTDARTVTCLRSDGQVVDDAQCAVVGAKPPTTQDGTDFSTCTFAWAAGTFTGPTTTCGTVTQTRSVYCQRSDSTSVDDSKCSGDKPASSQDVTDVTSCTYAWTPEDWGAAAPACGPSTQSRTIDCRRSDGANVDASLCSGTANTYATSQDVNDYSTCSYQWGADAWNGTAGCGASVTQTRNVYCLRSNGDHVADSFCSGDGNKIASTQTITDYSSCTYSWTQQTGPWTGGGTCSSTATRTNAVNCVRSDGTPMADQSFCDPKTKPSTSDTGDYEGCTYTGTYGAYGTCKAGVTGGTSGTQSATLTSCRRSDGSDVTAENVSKGYSECAQTSKQNCTVVYTPTWSSNYGACGNSSKTATTGTQTKSLVACTDPDGNTAPNFACDGYAAPSQSCTFTFTPTYSSTYGSCVNGQQSQTTTACTRSDGVSVDTSMCAAPTPRTCTNANIVTNGTFDGGNLAGWTVSNWGLATPGSDGKGYAAATTTNNADIKQTLTTTGGASYTITAWCFVPSGASGNVLVAWNGTYTSGSCGTAGSGWKQYTTTVLAKAGTTTSTIEFQSFSKTAVNVDTVSVVQN